jgi:hypothetical protein
VSRLGNLRATVARWPRPARRAGVAVLVAALAAAAVLLGLQAVDRHRAAEASASGLGAAGDLTRTLLSYDAAAIDVYTAAADAATTGAFHDEFGALVRDRVVPNAVERRATSQAEVVRSAVLTAEPDRVVALLFINQTTTGDHLPAPRIDAGSARVVVERVDGRWLVAGMDAA